MRNEVWLTCTWGLQLSQAVILNPVSEDWTCRQSLLSPDVSQTSLPLQNSTIYTCLHQCLPPVEMPVCRTNTHTEYRCVNQYMVNLPDWKIKHGHFLENFKTKQHCGATSIYTTLYKCTGIGLYSQIHTSTLYMTQNKNYEFNLWLFTQTHLNFPELVTL